MLASTASTNLRNLTAAAESFGVEFPEPVADLLAFDLDLPVLGDVHADAVSEISSAFGTKIYAKTRDAALARLARAEAAARITDPLREALVRARWTSVALHVEEILSAFCVALAESFDALNDAAPRVPATATESSTVSPDAYAARYAARIEADARSRVAGALAPLYDAGNVGAGIESGIARQRMMLVRMPEDLDRETGQEIARGLTGSRLVRMAGGTAGAEGLWWAVLAHHGVTFDLVSRDEHAENVARMRDAVRAPRLGETLPASLVVA